MEATPDSPMDSQCPALQQNRLSRGTKEFNPRIADIEELPPSPKKPVVTMEDLKNFEPPSYRASESPQTLPQDWFSINAEQAGELGLRPPNSKLLKRIMLFTPAFFAINMGTGILSILLRQTDALLVPAVGFFILNVGLFIGFVGLTVTRYWLWPRIFNIVYFHPVQSHFWGTASMAFATIVNFIVITFGENATMTSWVFWWMDAILSLVTNFGILFSLFAFQTQSLDTMTAGWLLAAVTTIVSSASGATVATFLDPPQARLTIVVSYFLLGTGLPTAFILLAIYASRLSFHNYPVPAAISSTFLPIGPMGQGAFSILKLGQAMRQLTLESRDFFGDGQLYSEAEGVVMARAVFAASIPIALVVYGFGFFWLVMAVAGTAQAFRKGMSFNLSWFGFTFPLGVLALASFQLGSLLGSVTFNVIGAMLTVALFLIWSYSFFRTVKGAINGSVFADPSLGELGKKL